MKQMKMSFGERLRGACNRRLGSDAGRRRSSRRKNDNEGTT